MRITATGIMAAVLATLVGCNQSPAELANQSPAERADELRARCARDAGAVAVEYEARNRQIWPDSVTTFTSHYNVRDQRCYAKLVRVMPPLGQAQYYLIDVDENLEIGNFSEDTSRCRVAERPGPAAYEAPHGYRKCASSDEFEALVKPYMEQ